jgi:hypothetical protein
MDKDDCETLVYVLLWFLVPCLATLALLIFLTACAGPPMPVEPFRCFDSFGKEVPCVEEMDCHEEPKGKEL